MLIIFIEKILIVIVLTKKLSHTILTPLDDIIRPLPAKSQAAVTWKLMFVRTTMYSAIANIEYTAKFTHCLRSLWNLNH